jgi:L-cysteine desulfidase
MNITQDALEIIFSTITTGDRAKAFAGIVWDILSRANTFNEARSIAKAKFGSGNQAVTAMLPYVTYAIDLVENSGYTLK